MVKLTEPQYVCLYYFILTVFGFFQDVYIGMEQRTGNHLLEVGYQKGATRVERNLVFNVHDYPGTASEFTDLIATGIIYISAIVLTKNKIFSKRRLLSCYSAYESITSYTDYTR